MIQPYTRERLWARAELRILFENLEFFLFAMTYNDAEFASGISAHARMLRPVQSGEPL